MSIAGKWGVSSDGEQYWVAGDTRDKALAESSPGDWIGQFEDPTPPENLWNAEDWIEHVLCHDDYNGDWAEHSVSASVDQLNELETEVRKVLAEWLDRHALRPTFGIVQDAEQVQ